MDVYGVIFWTLCPITMGTFFWLVWDVAHWVVKDTLHIGEDGYETKDD